MGREPLIVFGNRPRVARIPLRPRDESGHDLAVPQHVVGDEQPAGTQERHQPVEQRRVELFVAVLKDHVEWSADFRKHPLRIADDHVDAVRQPGPLEVVACLLCPVRVHLHRQQRSAVRQRTSQPDARVADRRADFQNARGAGRHGERPKESPDLGVDQRQVPLLAGSGDCLED